MLILFCFLLILIFPSVAWAWGPLTHVYLGHQVLSLGATLLPVGLYKLIKSYKSDFIYGNLMADVIFGKRFQDIEKNSHSWNVAWKLHEAAKTEQQKSFAYGYFTHLCADTVVHNLPTPTLPLKHPILEIKAESIIDTKYRGIMKNLDKLMQMRHDTFLERTLESVFFSFKTNKRIFKGFLFLSRLSYYNSPLSNLIDKRLLYEIPVIEIFDFQQESLHRMLEFLKNGKKSEVLQEDPLGKYRHRVS